MRKVIKGIGVYPSISIGKAFPLKKLDFENLIEEAMRKDISLKEVEEAIDKTKKELSKLIDVISDNKAKVGEFIEFQLMILEDDSFISKIRQLVEDEQKKPVESLKKVIDEIKEMFMSMKNIYMRERVSDIQDLAIRIFKNLLGKSEDRVIEGSILVSEELHPSEIILNHKKIIGIVTSRGTALSHIAIIARELGIPTIVGASDIVKHVSGGETVIINGLSGTVIVNPKEEEVKEFTKLKYEWESQLNQIIAKASKSAITRDGVRIEVVANLGRIDEIEIAAHYGAEGVGLFRTEFLFLGRDRPPSEDEQYETFKLAINRLTDGSIYIRTLDIGSDKQIPYIPLVDEPNPALGKRAIRLYNKEIKEIVVTQIKAILRAAKHGKVGIMFPMISDILDIEIGKKLIMEAKKRLKEENKEFGEAKVGIMIETPSAALLTDKFSDYVDFISIGTNDLTQYLLAVDRAGVEAPPYFDYAHPSVLRLIKIIVKSVKNKNIEVSVCGESGSDVYVIPILIGLGIKKLSVAPLLIPIVKTFIRNLNFEDLKEFAEEVLDSLTHEEVRKKVREYYRRIKLSLPMI